MKLTVLGSGSAVPRARTQPAYLLEHNGKLFLVDCGAGTLMQLAKLGIDFTKIDSILLSHFHNDHAGELPAIITGMMIDEKPRRKALSLFGPRGFKDFFRKLQNLYPEPLKKELFRINICELVNDSFKLNGLNVSTVSVRHTSSSIAYKFECNGKSVVYSGDTGFGSSITRFARGSDVLVLECSFPNSMSAFQKRQNTHLTAELCGRIAHRAKPKKLILTHLYPQAERTDIKRQVKKIFSGNVAVAKDLMEVRI